MILFGAHQLTKSFGSQKLFEDLSFSVESGERIGLIGPNGAGKSTLLKMIAGLESADEGQLVKAKVLRIGFLEQQPQFKPGSSIEASVMEGAQDPNDWQDMALAQECLSRLDLTQLSPDTQIESLSGGWKKRVALARELVKRPDLLLLDEPTNHLDVESILWLEEFINKSDYTTITITHDRVFLQNISNRIVELDKRHPKGLLSVSGNYLSFLEKRDDLLSAQERQETRLKNTLRRETEWLRAGVKARTTKQQARIKSAGLLKDAVEDLEERNIKSKVRLDFQSSGKAPKKLIEAKEISKSYDGKVIIPPTSLLITPKSRIGLMGPNGCGKSTLIRLLMKKEESDSGVVNHADRIEVSYFEQNRDSLDPKVSAIKTICPSGDMVEFGGEFIHINSYLSRFLFTFDKMQKEVGKLSGGEQSRLLLAKLMLTKANVLVLDEPTNDLDMATLDVLGDVLQAFSGAIILVTHDRYFLDQMTNQIIAFGVDEFGEKALVSMVGLDQWQVWHEGQASILKNPKPIASTVDTNLKQGNKKSNKLSYKDQRDLDTIEERIQLAEKRVEELSQECQKPEVVSDPQRLNKITREMRDAQDIVEGLYRRWEELS